MHQSWLIADPEEPLSNFIVHVGVSKVALLRGHSALMTVAGSTRMARSAGTMLPATVIANARQAVESSVSKSTDSTPASSACSYDPSRDAEKHPCSNAGEVSSAA
jgi:hypothetical protein